MSHQLLVLPFAYGLGFLAAMPIGASQVEVVKRALAQRYGSALLSAAGSVTSDMTYGFLALFGVARFLEDPSILVGFHWTTSAILAALSCLTWRQSAGTFASGLGADWSGHRTSYLTGLMVGISYPPIMLSWLLGAGLVKGMRMVDSFHPSLTAGFVLAGGAGLFSYLMVLTFILRRTHRFHSVRSVRVVYRGLSVLLGVIALGFFIKGMLGVLNGAPTPS